jgi:hypothetical protein
VIHSRTLSLRSANTSRAGSLPSRLASWGFPLLQSLQQWFFAHAVRQIESGIPRHTPGL